MRWLAAAAAVPAVAALSSRLQAATTLYWDPGATPANWDAGTTMDWNTGSNGATANAVWVNGDIAQFSDTTFTTTPYTANVAAAISAAGINFTLGAPTIDATTANTLTVTGNVSVSSGVTATFGASTASVLSLVVGANETWTDSATPALTVNTGVTANGSFTLTDSGTINFNGVLANGSGNLGLSVSAGTTTLSAANTFTGATNVLTGGTLAVAGANGAITGSSGITVNTGGTFRYDNTLAVNANRLGTTGLSLNGGTLTYAANSTNTVAGTTANIGAISLGANLSSFFNFSSATTGGTSLATIASLTPGSNSTLVATLGNANNSTGSIQLTSAANLALINGILPWAVETTNGNFLTVTGANNTVGAYASVGGTDQTTLASAPTSNFKISAIQTIGSSITINSLVDAFGGNQGLSGNTLTLTSGGLLLNNSSAVLGSAANDGAITTAAANPTLFIDTNASATINSAITDASGPTSVSLVKFGNNTLTLAGLNTYSGSTTIEAGTLAIASGGSLNTAGTATIQPAGALTLNGGSTVGNVLANGTLTFAGSTAVTFGNVTGSGATGVVTYNNTLAAGTTINFTGTNSFKELNNIAAGGSLTLTGIGSTNTFALFPEANVGPTTTATNFVSGTYIFTGGGSNVSANNLGAFTVSGANVTFAGGLRFSNNGGGNVTVSSGLLQAVTNFDTNQETSGTTVNFNVNGGIFDVAGTGANLGNEAAEAAATNDNINVAGGLFQLGFTSSSNTYNLTIGGASANVRAAVNLSSGTIRDNGTIQGGGTPAATGINQLNLTGGTLTASQINLTNLGSNDGVHTATTGTLYNGGATLAPGYFGQAVNTAVGSANVQFTGKTTITGNYSVDSANAALAINIGGTTAAGNFGTLSTDYDDVTVTGSTLLGGKLTLGLLGSYIPAFSQTFTILTDSTASGITGNFANVLNSGGVAAATGTVSLANGATFLLTDNGTTLVLNDYTAPSVTWAGTNTVWDASTQDFFITGGTTPTNFANGDSVVFDQTGIAQPTVNLNIGVVTAALTFNNTSGTYLITGTGSITGASLAVTGSGGTDIIGVSSSFTGATTIASGSTLQLGNGGTVGGVGSLSAITDNGTLAFNRTNTVTQGTDFSSTAITGAANLVQAGSGTLILTAANTVTGTTTISAGTLQLGNAGATGGIGGGGTLVDNGTLFINRTGTITQGTDFPTISGTGGVVLGSGTTVMNASNSYSGTTNISGGTLTLAGSGTVAVGSVVGTGGTGVINYTNTLAAGNTVNFSGTNSFLGLNNVTGGNTLILTGVGSNNTFAQYPSNLVGSSTSTSTYQSGTYTFVAGAGGANNNDLGTFNVAGATVVFAGGIPFLDGGSGGTTNVSAGTLQVKSGFGTYNSDYAGLPNTSINFNVTGGLVDFSGTNLNYGNAGSGGSKANSQSDNFNISGGVVQVGITNGAASIILGDNTANVHTTFAQSGGTLLVNGTIQAQSAPAATSSINFNFTGGTLTASGVNMTNLASNDGINSATSGTLYNGGGTVYPGGTSAGGVLVSGKTTLTGNYLGDNNTHDVLAFNIGGTTASGAFQDAALGKFSLLAASGGVTVDGSLNVTVLSGYTPSSTSQLYQIVTAGSPVAGTFSNLTLVSGSTYSGTTTDGGYTYEAIFNNGGTNNITLTDFSSSVPEPTSLGLLGLSGLAMMRRRRKTGALAANRAR